MIKRGVPEEHSGLANLCAFSVNMCNYKYQVGRCFCVCSSFFTLNEEADKLFASLSDLVTHLQTSVAMMAHQAVQQQSVLACLSFLLPRQHRKME